jgi:hypothetical protein
LFYPFYAAAHALPMAVGYLNWISYCLVGKRVYRDHYETRIGSERARELGVAVGGKSLGAAA